MRTTYLSLSDLLGVNLGVEVESPSSCCIIGILHVALVGNGFRSRSTALSFCVNSSAWEGYTLSETTRTHPFCLFGINRKLQALELV